MLEKLLSPRIALTVTRWAIVRRVDIEPAAAVPHNAIGLVDAAVTDDG